MFVAARSLSFPRLCLLVLSFLPASAAAHDFFYVERESSWRFFVGTEEPVADDLAAWRAGDFDDAAWEEGLAPLGYGDPPYGTDLGERDPPFRGNSTTLYLRQAFDVEELDRAVALHARVDYDDGFIAWLNGVEVLRVNMRDDVGEDPAHTSRARRSHESGSYEEFVIGEASEFLTIGENQLAVLVMNTSLNGNDLKFDLELFDPFGPDVVPPVVDVLLPPADTTTRTLSQIKVTFDEPVRGVDASDLLVGGVPAESVEGSGEGPYLFSFPMLADGPVDVAWIDAHGIVDQADEPNAFAGGSWAYTVDADAPLPTLRISEFLAANGAGLRDEDRDTPDWVEIENYGDTAIDLRGWSLSGSSDDPGEWLFPAETIEPGAFLIVFASGNDRAMAGEELHTSFKLNRSGDYLALFSPELPRRAVSLFDEYPEQRTDHSYGRAADGNFGYFLAPTPGEPNEGDVLTSLVADPEFSVEHGFFDAPFDLDITCATPGAQIYVTVDGSEPTPTGGQLIDGAIPIEPRGGRGGATIRAAAFLDGALPSRTTTATYIFPAAVLEQPRLPDGYPTRWGSAPGVDYEMDPEVTDDPDNAGLFTEAFLALPSLCINGSVEDLFGSSGLYSNSQAEGVRFERGVSAELIQPDGSEGFQIDCGARMHGGASRNPDRSPKHNWRLLFKGAYGPTKLKYALFPDSDVDTFDTIVLRANYNNSWIHWDSGQRRRGTMVRDQFMRDTIRDMGQIQSHGRFIHLFVNGMYWGMYNVMERPSAPFAASHFGGDKSEWDALNSAVPVDGNGSAWSQLLAAAGRDLNDQAQYEALAAQLDIAPFVDYMLANFYGSNADWPSHNWYSARRRIDGAKWYFFSWDAERVLEGIGDNRTGASDGNSPGQIWQRLRTVREFQVAFGDRVQKHLFGDGVLTPEVAQARYKARAAEVEPAMILEAARWGDYRRDVHSSSNGPYEFYRYRTHWLPEQARLETYFPRRSDAVLAQLRRLRVYPRTVAPVLSVAAGEVEAGTLVEISLPGEPEETTIYVTTDGTDPRLAFTGEVAASATEYVDALLIDGFTHLKARALSGEEWSALVEAIYTTDLSSPAALEVSEIMYNPDGSDEAEFIELHNPTAATLSLGGVEIAGGIEFTFEAGASIEAGAYLVLARDLTGFTTAHPDASAFAAYSGSLANAGEKITVRDSEGNVIESVDYDDDGYWPRGADGFGHSLVRADRAFRLDDARAWQASAQEGGSPGEADGGREDAGVHISEVLLSGGGALELWNRGLDAVEVGGWQLATSRDDVENGSGYVIAAGSIIPAGGFLSFDGAELGLEFTLGRSTFLLSGRDGDGMLTGHIVGIDISGAEEGVPQGAHVASGGLVFTALASHTPGEANSEPRVPEIAINEIHYHPAQNEDGVTGLEFLELYNPGTELVDLGGWELGGVAASDDVDQFIFPPDSVLPSGGYLVLVPVEAASGREALSIPAASHVIGPYAGGLDNSGERLRLRKPGSVEGSWIEVDRVRYNDRTPWATEADGDGPSLERISAELFAGDAGSWGASASDGGTPGAINSIDDPGGAGVRRIPGDINVDARLNVTDAVVLLAVLFPRGARSPALRGDGRRTRKPQPPRFERRRLREPYRCRPPSQLSVCAAKSGAGTRARLSACCRLSGECLSLSSPAYNARSPGLRCR